MDVNVTPDKRTLYVQNEKILLATIKVMLNMCKKYAHDMSYLTLENK